MRKLNIHYLFIICFFVLALLSCKENNTVKIPTSSTKISYLQDTLQKHAIDSIVDEINKDARQHKIFNKIAFPIYNENDSIVYWQRNGELSVIEANFIYPDKLVWPTFYLLNEEPIYIRYRFVTKNYPLFVMETLIYLNANDIVYCLERKMDLKPGELPGLLKDKNFNTCSGTHDSVHKLYMDYWPPLKKFVKDYINKSQN